MPIRQLRNGSRFPTRPETTPRHGTSKRLPFEDVNVYYTSVLFKLYHLNVDVQCRKEYETKRQWIIGPDISDLKSLKHRWLFTSKHVNVLHCL